LRARTLTKITTAICFAAGALSLSFGYITKTTSPSGSSDYLTWTVAGLVMILLGCIIHFRRTRVRVKRKSFYKL